MGHMSTADRESIISELEEGMANSTLKNQRQLALAAGIKYTQLNDFMTNRSGMINAASLEKLRDAIARHRTSGVVPLKTGEQPAERKTSESNLLLLTAKLSILIVANSHGKFIPEDEVEELAQQLYAQVKEYRDRGKQEEPSELAARLLMQQKGYL
jgi:hypothetical protein